MDLRDSMTIGIRWVVIGVLLWATAVPVRALVSIDRIRDPAQTPSLTHAGTIDASFAPDDLVDYAEQTLLLALDARAEIDGGADFDHETVATALRTIEHLITRTSPHSYRSRAGLAP